MINISHKDKSVILLILVSLVILWFTTSSLSTIFSKISFKNSEINKINNVEKNSWLNVSQPIKSENLKGKIIVLYFWSYSCVSCIEAMEKIKELEARYQNSIAIIGVHSPIFENEKKYNAVKKAVIRHKIDYPIINDVDHKITNSFNVDKTPTFLIFDLKGKIVKRAEGAKSVENVIKNIKKLVNKNKFSINHEKLPIVLESNNNIFNTLNSPRKLTYAENFSYKGRNNIPVLIIANSGQNSIIISQITGELIFKIGSGISGLMDGSFSEARFSSPESVAFDGKNIYVADTKNNAIRLIDIEAQKVKTIIGSGSKGENIELKKTDAKEIDLFFPTDIEFYPNNSNLVISNSGTNQILGFDIKSKVVSIIAGNGESGQQDGVYPNNTLSQTSDMAVYGDKLYLLDAKTSSLRYIDKDLNLKTLYKAQENINSTKKLQNPQGLIVDDTGAYIADSFNHSIRKYDFNTNQLTTLVGAERGEDVGNKTTFDEPSGLVAIIDKLYVADTNNNRIVAVNRANGTSSLIDIIPPQKLYKESFVEYFLGAQENDDIYVKSLEDVHLKIKVKNGWKINPIGPSFINLLELKDEDSATLINTFDWNDIISAKTNSIKLKDDKKYLLQGKIYFCRNTANALCYIKNYEQKIIAKNDSQQTEIEITIGK